MDQDIFAADPRLRPQRGPADRSHCRHPVSYRKKIQKKTERGERSGVELSQIQLIIHRIIVLDN